MRPSELDPERWRRIDEVFEAALETPPHERSDLLTQLCADDEQLRTEVEALLHAAEQGEARFEPPPSPFRTVETPAEVLVEGRKVGPFRLLREIGRGGMGVVYEAEDTRLGRSVAIKALPPYLGIGDQAKQRFMSEARAISALDHPNIATLYEIDETDDGQLYMAFAFYPGETLAERVDRGPVAVEEATEIVVRIADGLAAAHAHGIIHRDVKPSNVLLTEGGEVKLLDFGVAKMAGEDVTREGVWLGTVAYMSPEQAGADPVDHRTDLWSLGVVFYELLTGERPFRGADHTTLVKAILDHDPEPPTTLRGGLPVALEQIVLKLLCKEPEGRYQSAENLAIDLRAVLSEEAPQAAIQTPPGGRGRIPPKGSQSPQRTWRRLVATVLGLAAIVGGAWVISKGARTMNEPIERLAVLPLENLTGDPEQQYFVDGIHAALITELGKIGALDIMSRTSMTRYRDTQMSIEEIASELNVDAVVEGSVLRQGDSLTVTAQLIAASPERLLWTESYRRTVERVFDVTSQVARSIAAEIEITMSPQEELRLTSPQPVKVEAYDAYLRGWFHWERRNRESLELARNYFRRAMVIDSTFAPAYAGLSQTYNQAADWVLEDPAEALPRARELAQTALRLDGDLGDAYAALARVEFLQNWDWEESERLSRRALELNPSDTHALRALGATLGRQGRRSEAHEAHDRANELDPTSPDLAVAFIAYFRRDYDAAIDHARASLELDEGFWQSGWLICMALIAKGAHSEAIDHCEQVVERFDRNPVALAGLGYAYGLAGQRDEARRILAELDELADEVYVAPALRAMVYGSLGDRDSAFAWLDRAYDDRDPLLLKLRTPLFEPLHSDPRYEILLRRIGIEGNL